MVVSEVPLKAKSPVMPTRRDDRRIAVTLWLIAILYLLVIDRKGIWTDEGYRYLLFAGGQTWGEFSRSHSFGPWSAVLKAVGHTPYQPLFYIIANTIIRVAGSFSAVMLRAINILWLLCGALGLVRFFRTYSMRTRVFAVVIYALNGYMMMHVMEIREYPMTLAFMIWSGCLCFELLELPASAPWWEWWSRLIAYGFVVALLFYSHPYGAFPLAAQVVMVLTRMKDKGLFLTRMACAYILAAILAAPWLLWLHRNFPHRYTNYGVFGSDKPTLALLISRLADGFRKLLVYDNWTGHPLMQAFVGCLIIGVVGAWIGVWRMHKSLDRRAVYGALTMLFYGCFQVRYFFQQDFFTWPRYFFAYYMGYTILATCAFGFLELLSDETKKFYWRALAAGIFVFVCISGLTQVYGYWKWPFMDTDLCNWRAVSRVMARHIRPDETIVYDCNRSAWTLGVINPNYPKEIDFPEILSGPPLHFPRLWVLDTSAAGWNVKAIVQRLESWNYQRAESIDIGCNDKLLRFDAQPASPHLLP